MVCCALTAFGNGLYGCQATPPDPVQTSGETARAPEAAAVSSADQQRLAVLLEQAEQALTADHLTFPAKDSALTLLDAARTIDPDNDDVQRGFERIVERYIDMAERAASRGQLAQARSMLDRARIVDAEHPAIGPSARRLELLQSTDRERLRIDAGELRAKSPTLITALQEIARSARQAHCRAIIRVGNDTDGRWIYQKMSTPGQRRIRAQVQIGTPPQVEVLCFSS